MSGIAFTPEDLVSAKKDFRGVIVVSTYEKNKKFTGMQLHIEMQTETYDKNQHEWLSPSDKLKTKWAHFIKALSDCGALKDMSFEGKDSEERMQNFAKSLLGMQFRFVEYTDLPSIAKNRVTGKFEVELTIPKEYLGKTEIGEIQKKTVGEVDLT